LVSSAFQATAMGDDFDSFCDQAQIILSGPPLDRQFLSGLWDGADKDLNRAINHLLGLPEDKVVREGQGGGGASPVESKPSKKESKSSKKVSKEGKKKEKKEEAKPTADDWGGGFFDTSASGFPDSGFQTDFPSGGFQTGIPQSTPAFPGMAGTPQVQQPFQTLPPAQQMPSYPDPSSFAAPFQSQPAYPHPNQPYGQQMSPTQPHQPQQPLPHINQGPPLSQPPPNQSMPNGFGQSMQHLPFSPNQSPMPDSAKMPMGQPYGAATPSTAWDSESDSENDWWNNPAPLAYHGGNLHGAAPHGPMQSASCFSAQMAGGQGGGFAPGPQFGSQAMPGWG